MEVRYATNPGDMAAYSSSRLRSEFLVYNLFVPEQLNLTYTHYDRMILGGAVPIQSALLLSAGDALKTAYFLERREVGIVNIGQTGRIVVDGESYTLENSDCLFVGRGAREVELYSANPLVPAKFYIVSCPAHQTFPTTLIRPSDAESMEMGSSSHSNFRTIRRYIHFGGVQSSQLVLGITEFHENSMWNTMPPHVHDRRMEAYLYFDMPEDARVFHFMGDPNETRHLVVANEEAVVSPSWSIHCGVGTSKYRFIWAMAGENYDYSDQDPVAITELR